MADLKALYDRSGKPRFLAYKAYQALVPLADTLKPDNNPIDRFFLSLQNYLKGAEIGDMPPFPLQTLLRYMAGPIKGALFYNTSDTRDTSYIGLVQSDQVEIVRVFPTPDDVIFAAHQARFVQEHLSGPFLIMPVTFQQDVLLVSSFMRRKRAVTRHDYVEEKLLHLSDIFARNTTIRKDIHDMVPIDFHALCANAGYVELSALVRHFLATRPNETVPVVPVHGDMTPDHVFINEDEKIVLTDYERAGWHVPYYDYYHYILHPHAAQKRAPTIASFNFDTNHPQAKQFLILYLIDQLYQDISSLVFKKHEHSGLHHQIGHNADWLRTLLAL